MNPAEFAKLFVEMAAAMEIGFKTEMEECARIVEKEAKAMIGNPVMINANISPLRPWAPLAPDTVADKQYSGYGNMGPLERTGTMRLTIQHDAGPFEARVGSDDDVALWQELGTTGPHPIPPRSFLGGAAIRKGPECAELIWLGTKVILQGEKTSTTVRFKGFS